MGSVKGQEITYEFNKYNETALLNEKESLVQIILNALMMVPGNLPSQPKKGVNIFQYLYRTVESEEISDSVLYDLKYTVGDEIGSDISDLTVDVLETETGPLFLLIIHLVSNTTNSEDNVALAIQKVNQKVRFNYSFLTDAIKNMK